MDRNLKQIFLQGVKRTCHAFGMRTKLKDAQHHPLLEKCKSKPQWDITSHRSEWSSSKSLQTINARGDVEKRECSCTAGGNVNWCSYYGRWYGDSFKNSE